MEYEREGLLLPKTAQEPFDYEIFGSFEDAHKDLRETYKELTPSSEKKDFAKEAWPLGINADLSIDKLNVNDLLGYQSNLRLWKKELLENQNIDADIKQLYRWRINEDIASVGMLISSRAGDMASFRRWNEFIYGKPNEAIYKAALDWVATDAENILSVENQNPIVSEAAKKVVDMLQDKRGQLDIIVPDKDTFERVRDDHMNPMGYYGLLLAGIERPKDKKVSNEVGDVILGHIVRDNLQSDYEITDASSASWGVSHGINGENGKVDRPKSYNLPIQRFFGLVGHEVGSHLLEKVNGGRGPIKLASVGLDRYESGNEGRAVIREQVQYETFDEFGKLVRWRDILRRHIAISYACGVGENNPIESSKVYEFMNTIDTMYQTKATPDKSPEEIKAKADEKTSSLLLRVLKGTDGNGGAYYKDKVYLEGVVSAWLTASAKGPNAISEGDLGKFDINNARHIIALQKIGLLPNNE